MPEPPVFKAFGDEFRIMVIHSRCSWSGFSFCFLYNTFFLWKQVLAHNPKLHFKFPAYLINHVIIALTNQHVLHELIK